jgi:hypothetical protein
MIGDASIPVSRGASDPSREGDAGTTTTDGAASPTNINKGTRSQSDCCNYHELELEREPSPCQHRNRWQPETVLPVDLVIGGKLSSQPLPNRTTLPLGLDMPASSNGSSYSPLLDTSATEEQKNKPQSATE